MRSVHDGVEGAVAIATVSVATPATHVMVVGRATDEFTFGRHPVVGTFVETVAETTMFLRRPAEITSRVT